MIRSILGIIVGYFIFVVSAVLLFAGSGINPHAEAPLWFMVLASLYGTLFSALGGYAAALIAGRKALLHSGILTLVIISGAVVSLASSYGKEAVWSQLTAIVLMAPSALLGGYIRSKQTDN
jgi:hypothetical protein